MTTSTRLFLAHASEDKPAVRQLYRELKARGFAPWLDSEDLLPGQLWKVEIPKAIRDAAVFLACLSSRSVAKIGYVQNEFRLALSAFGQRPAGSIYLIPVRLDDCEVPDLHEAEWEYACRAGTTTAFHFGATISTDQANYLGTYTYGSGKKGDYREQTVPVGSFPANAFGLHDMHGTVWEWCADVWHDSYAGAPTDGTACVEGGDQGRRVSRGGSWDFSPRSLRSAIRSRHEPEFWFYNGGFRVARTLR
jgi:hypothetical protein